MNRTDTTTITARRLTVNFRTRCQLCRDARRDAAAGIPSDVTQEVPPTIRQLMSQTLESTENVRLNTLAANTPRRIRIAEIDEELVQTPEVPSEAPEPDRHAGPGEGHLSAEAINYRRARQHAAA